MSTNVPRQVVAQVERAAQIQAELYGPKAEEPQQETEVPQPEESQEQAPEPTVENQPEQQPAEPAEPAPEAKPKSEDWEAKYRTLQGILNAEKGRWAAEKQALEERIRSLQQAAAQPEPPPASAQAAVRKLITEQDKETYGPELLDLIARAAAEQADQIVQQRLAELKPEIEQAKQKVTEVTQQVYQSKEQEFYGKLAQAVPDWETVNVDEGWLRWLGEPDPVFGVPRQVALDNAARALDHERVARMFNTYKQLAGIGQQAPAQPEPAPKKPALSPTPRAVGNASAPTHREPQTGVTRSEIAAHARKALDPAYRASKEYQAFEQRLAVAMATGNIIDA